jgi:hypothetical protein
MDGQDLRAVAIEIYDLISRGDLTRLEELLPEDESLPIVIGTAPGEWFEGRSDVLVALAAQVRDYPNLRIEAGDLRSGEDGEMGWIADRPALVMPDGSRLATRQTSTFKREAGTWRLVCSHLSIGVADDDDG